MITISFNSYFELFSCIYSSVMLAFLIQIIFQMLNEYFRNREYYDAPILKSVLLRFQLSNVAYSMICFETMLFLFHGFNTIFNIFGLMITLIVLAFLVIRFSECSHTFALFLRKDTGIDFCSGMASSYLHGFLNIVLPEDKTGYGFSEAIKKYENDQQILDRIAVHKLFILIPRSLYSEKTFDDDFIEKAAAMDTFHCNRAGVRDRPYKVEVHRFKNSILGENYYIAAECATPLLTFYESINKSKCTSKPIMSVLQKEIALRFGRYLEHFGQETREIREYVEIVYFDDKCEKVGQVLETAYKALMFPRRDLVVSKKKCVVE